MHTLIAYRRTWLKLLAAAAAEGLVLQTLPKDRGVCSTRRRLAELSLDSWPWLFLVIVSQRWRMRASSEFSEFPVKKTAGRCRVATRLEDRTHRDAARSAGSVRGGDLRAADGQARRLYQHAGAGDAEFLLHIKLCAGCLSGLAEASSWEGSAVRSPRRRSCSCCSWGNGRDVRPDATESR